MTHEEKRAQRQALIAACPNSPDDHTLCPDCAQQHPELQYDDPNDPGTDDEAEARKLDERSPAVIARCIESATAFGNDEEVIKLCRELKDWWNNHLNRRKFEISPRAAFEIAKRCCYATPTPEDARDGQQHQLSDGTIHVSKQTPLWISEVDSEDYDCTVYDPEYCDPESFEDQKPMTPYFNRLKSVHLDAHEDGTFQVYLDGYG